MTKKVNNKILFLYLIIIGVFSLQIKSTYADAVAKEGIGFQVQPVFNSSQVEDGLGYYYVHITPGESQNLELIVTNTTEKDIKLKAFIENAVSTNYGSLDYSSDLKKVDSSLKKPLTEIIKVEPQTFELPGKKSEIIKLKLTAPNEKFSGIKMGRIIIIQEKEKKEEESGPISNEYQYGVGIIATEEVAAFNDGKTLKLNNVEPKIDNAFRVVSADISAPESKTIEGLKIRSYVTKKGENKKIKERNVDNFMFSPNSKVSFQIPWGTTNFEPGDYTFYFNAKNSLNSFSLVKDFKITKNSSNKLNNKAAFSVQTPQSIKIILVVMNSLLILVAIYILWRDKSWVKRLRSMKKSNKKNRKTKKSKAHKKINHE